MKKEKRFLILDANTLIDFYKSDRMLIKLFTTYLGEIYLAKPVFDEVWEINANDCIELGIILVEPGLEQLLLASEGTGSLSFQDKLCYILAKDNQWACVTNDKPLRRVCQAEDIEVVWGIELICILVESGGLPVKQAKDMILRIQKLNPKYITEKIIQKAFERLGKDSK
ncbi:hypothetical protein [Dethiobacter alkaliphilus]|uniref:PIN domain-containing protein n=1 Tax=Dethiobacter alkaliphilus AHT 1 TaxID=555088 RepID=C0GGM9_DETAL|nr:hypothetical protein [Dethiobacter alkaliphilus]EEG77470.1 conserved hypothetical protein [Dethiobacter alkaliphilus AHT 1]